MSEFADSLVESFGPWLTPDLEDYLRAIATMFSEVELLAFDNEGGEGWTALFDPDRAPEKALPYLAVFVGERLPVGISAPAAREWIKDAPNQRRGTPRSIFLATQRRLTGNRLVRVVERDGDVDELTVYTYAAQTPDEAGTEADIRSVLPADVILNYTALVGQLWEDVDTDHADWDAVAAAYDNWAEVSETIGPGDEFFERPMPE